MESAPRGGEPPVGALKFADLRDRLIERSEKAKEETGPDPKEDPEKGKLEARVAELEKGKLAARVADLERILSGFGPRPRGSK